MSSFQLRRLGLMMEPQSGNSLETEGVLFDAQLNCRLSAQINCHATWKEEEGFLLPSSGFRI
jgi:hypothetical protein